MPVTVKQDDKPVPVEVIARAILEIAQGVRKLRAGPLNDKALILLIRKAAPKVGGPGGRYELSQKEVRAVLDGIDALEATYLKKRKA